MPIVHSIVPLVVSLLIVRFNHNGGKGFHKVHKVYNRRRKKFLVPIVYSIVALVVTLLLVGFNHYGHNGFHEIHNDYIF